MPVPNGLLPSDAVRAARYGMFRSSLATKGVAQSLINEYLPVGQNPQEFTNEQLSQAMIEICKRLPKA
jgi:hypothetical protein